MLRILLLVLIASMLTEVASAQATDSVERVEAVRNSAAGGPTSSGEPYNPERLTMAHPSLPMGTLVEITFRRRTVTVRVNDRSPSAGSVLLSARAADQLGLPPGGAPVELRLGPGERALVERRDPQVRDAPTPTVEAPPEGSGAYVVQIGAFSEESSARGRAASIPGATIVQGWADGAPVHRVFYGRFETSEAAAAARDRLGAQGVDGFVRRLTDVR